MAEIDKQTKRIGPAPIPVDGGKPMPACQVTVVYPFDDPMIPQAAVSKGCSDAEAAIALSIIVTALLKAVAEAREQ